MSLQQTEDVCLRPHRPRKSALATAILSAGLALPCIALAPLAHAAEQAQASAEQKAFRIAAGPLGAALTRFSGDAGVVVSFDANLTAGRNTAGLNGVYSVEQGFALLLQGSGLLAQKVDERTYLVSAAQQGDAISLGPVSIRGQELAQTTEGSGSYTTGSTNSATKMNLSLKETPQSVSVITRQTMDDFNLASIDDVMRHTPGVTVATFDSERTNYYARGFAIQSFQYDGIPTTRNDGYSAGQTLSDMAIYDRVEVLKGAPGLMTGAGGPGGTINLIRKKPTAQFQGHVDLGAGSWDNYRSELDLSGPLTDSGNVRGRAVMVYQDKHSFMDHYERKTNVYYGTLEFDLSPDTLLTVGADYQNNDPKGSSWTGSRSLFDTAGDEISFPRSYNNGPKWSGWQQYSRSVFATLEHNLDNGWVAKANYTNQLNGYNAPLGYASPNSTTTASVYAAKYTGRTISNNLDMYLSGPFSLAGREHQLVVGTSTSRSHWKDKDYYNGSHGNYDLYGWDGDDNEPDWGSPSMTKDDVTRQNAVYFSTRLSLTDDLSLLLGSRLTDYRLTGTNDSTETGKVIPYVGVVYDINDNVSAYASYTEIFMPQMLRPDRNNKMVEPDEGKNYEVGLKGEFFGGRLNTSLAYFEVHEENRAEEDTEYNNNPTNLPLDWAYVGIKAKTKGYEAEISGELAPGWQLQAGYTHKISRDDSGKKISTWEPEDQLNFYTSYKLTGSLDKLTLGGGARWQGKGWQDAYNYGKGVNQVFSQDPYWLVDVMARYQVSKNLSASVNVNNVLDKKYFTNIGFYRSSYYGDPRNVMVSARWSF